MTHGSHLKQTGISRESRVDFQQCQHHLLKQGIIVGHGADGQVSGRGHVWVCTVLPLTLFRVSGRIDWLSTARLAHWLDRQDRDVAWAYSGRVSRTNICGLLRHDFCLQSQRLRLQCLDSFLRFLHRLLQAQCNINELVLFLPTISKSRTYPEGGGGGGLKQLSFC